MSEPAIELSAVKPTINSAWGLDVNTGTFEAPVWTKVRGVANLVPAIANTRQDATDYDTEGWGSDAVTLRKWSLTATLRRNLYGEGSDFVRDEGQEAVRAAADALDPIHIRWYDRSDDSGEAYQGYAIVEWSVAGGDATGLQAANVTFLGQGRRAAITNPVAA